MDTPASETALEWLKQHLTDTQRSKILLEMSAGAPLNALRMAADDFDSAYQEMFADWLALGRGEADPVKIADQWLKVDKNKPIFWAYEWISQMIKLKSCSAMNNDNKEHSELKALLQDIQLKQLYGLFDQIVDAVRIAHTQANHLMLLERILVYWSNLPRQKA
jgi:hypothetical protein